MTQPVDEGGPPSGQPTDDYTPYGYLNLAGHTRRVRPRGVMRSNGIGFGWHFPSFASGYGGRTERYRAGFTLGSGTRTGLCSFEQVSCPQHSMNLVEFHAHDGEEALQALFFLVDDDTLCARIEGPLPSRLTVHLWYQRVVAADGDWGESGLVGRITNGATVLQSFEDGDAFAFRILGADAVTEFDGEPPMTVLGEPGQLVSLSALVAPRATGAGPVWLILTRGRTANDALRRAPAVATLEASWSTRAEADRAFWASAPVLSGDWPTHWRRGMVYDLETLRMMVKEPVGRYRHRWDAMQIQSPRTVLAEAAMDALALSWADPVAAADMLLGVFANAEDPNVACSREDGTYNMVSADGTACGTGPQWGYPFLVAAMLDVRLGDPAWLGRLYPYLAAYLRWWTEQRRIDGWFVHACSWESGQDCSPRFGDQPLGGGHPTWHLRPVDLHASVAHAATVLAGFAERVAPGEVADWQQLASEAAALTRSMWVEDRFADVDSRRQRPTDVDDVMLLSPLALGVATAEQAARLEPALRELDADALVWPMFIWTPALAASAAGLHDVAGELTARVIDRAYRHWDRRENGDGRTLPGIACEYWPLSGRCGGEGYGWGAFTTELLLSTVVGLAVDRDGVRVRPALPKSLRTSGSRYRVTLTIRGRRCGLSLEPDADSVTVSGLGPSVRLAWGEQLVRGWAEL